jgi:tetratricopeptide (TPR) repeat protein
MVLQARRELAGAEDHIRRALAVFEAAPGDDRADALRIRDNLAGVLIAARKPAEAEEVFRGSVAIQREQEHPDPVRLANTLSGLGQVLCTGRRFEEAEPLLREALALRQQAGVKAWMIANSRSVLGACLSSLRRAEEAGPLLTEGAEALERELGPRHPRTLQALGRLLAHLEASGDEAGAAAVRARLGDGGRVPTR